MKTAAFILFYFLCRALLCAQFINVSFYPGNIQVAADAAAGGVLYFPAGTYAFNGPVFIHSNTTVQGDVGTFIVPVYPFTPLVDAAAQAVIDTFFVNEHWLSDTIQDHNITYADLAFGNDSIFPGHMIFSRKVQGLQVLNCTFINSGGDATASMSCVDVLIDSCTDTNMANASYDFWASPVNCTVQNCVSSNTAVAVQFNAVETMVNGVFDFSGNAWFPGNGQNLQAINNQADLSPANFTKGLYADPLGKGSTMSNVQFVNNRVVGHGGGQVQGITIHGANGFQIIGNTIANIRSLRSNASALGVSADARSFPATNASNGLIQNNRFRSCIIPNGYGISVVGAAGVTETGNTQTRCRFRRFIR